VSPDEHPQLVRLVSFLMAANGSEAEQHAALEELESRVLHPRVSNLIYWPRSEGFDRELTAEEIVHVATSYRPIPL
jgi:hypothetical protein